VVFGRASLNTSNTFDVTTLNGMNGFKVYCPTCTMLGFVVKGGFDIDGDGKKDLFITDPWYSIGGSMWVIYGRASYPPTIDIASLLSTDGFRIDAEAYADWTSPACATPGDFDGDGRDDIFFGAHGFDTDESGMAYMLKG
jgi:FG-GAP-like repeat